MDLRQLAYRIQVGGYEWLVNTAIGYFKERFKRAVTETNDNVVVFNADTNATLRILYIHNGWAVCNVGAVWFALLDQVEVTFVRVGDSRLTPAYLTSFDFVWFGFWQIYQQYKYTPERSILTVHDPITFYQPRANWKDDVSIPAQSRQLLQALRLVTVISKEMEDVLASQGVRTLRIPTRSHIPLRSEIPAATPEISALAVGRIYRRKNFGVLSGD